MKRLLTISALLTITFALIAAGCANENGKNCNGKGTCDRGQCKGGEGCESGKCEGSCPKDKLCTSCGQVKGSEACCDENAEKCPKCNLAKGSPGCCKLPAAPEAPALCTMCGEVKGSDKCCK